MKKLILIIFTISLLLVGCNENSSLENQSEKEKTKTEATSNGNKRSFEDKQQEIVNFINKDIQEIVGYETEANQVLATVSGENYHSDEELYEVLANKVIPTYQKAVNKAKSLVVEAEELKPLKAKIEEATGIYYDALMLEKEGLEKKDTELINQSNGKGQEYKKVITEYHVEMKNLAKEYNIDYEQESAK
ncbi:hypothetical protein MZM54_09335 [[Brevibacterium] frigoritolerans]|uniref:hypothetical protein n=1 Tax=Peribacillus frigoritolerans TaxID=450367 RepID=UPI0020BFBE34|nr:hypothetical protein [Peribacillus frigoritolerans]MCK2001604.1 hypothetical protein [Peribacillus frigoritolerans]